MRNVRVFAVALVAMVLAGPSVGDARSAGKAAAAGPPAHDATAVLERVSQTMGASALGSLRYAAEGVGWTYGQSFTPGAAWPKITIHAQQRTINYVTASMREEITLSRAEPKGGGGYPQAARQTSDQFLSGQHAWNQAGGNPQPGPRFVNDRIHQLWITPHGAVKAALRNKATVVGGGANGRGPAMLAFIEPGRFHARLFINADNLVERVETIIADTVTGEVATVTRYGGYGRHVTVLFPSRIQQSIGGFPTLDVRVTAVEPNVPADIAVPDTVRNARETVTAEEVAEGVWFLAGGSHNSVAIRMRDYMILVEAPLNDGRMMPVVEQVLKLGAGRPIRYAINTHQHYDHSGGVRMAVALGATIVTHASNVGWYEKAFATPNTIAPDLLTQSRRKARVVGIGGGAAGAGTPERTVIDDGERRVELLPILDSVHNDAFLMVWLPKERLLIEADAYTPGAAGAPPPQPPTPNSVNLVENIERAGLDVGRILPLHGRIASGDELMSAAGRVPRR